MALGPGVPDMATRSLMIDYYRRRRPNEELPADLEYRLVGRYLILRDVDAALILDYLAQAVPSPGSNVAAAALPLIRQPR